MGYPCFDTTTMETMHHEQQIKVSDRITDLEFHNVFFWGVCKYPTIETTLKHVVIGPLFEGNNCLVDAAMYRFHPWRSAMSGVSVDTEFEKGTVAVKRN